MVQSPFASRSRATMILIGLFCLGLAHALVRIDPLVSTKVGLIRGLRTDDGYSKFLGIPYATVDEKNPFGPSTPQPSFDEVFEAFDGSIECPQVFKTIATGTIQCLSLNVYVPNTATSQNRLPVMVWIHGGAFVEGSARFDTLDLTPTSLLKQDVIVVAINYRIGVYGFMCLDTPEVPGNQGLKDQVLALRWINENIEAFGGDASKITIFGESAGAMSVNMHLFSPHEKLFSQAIIQSGPALSYWMMVESDVTVPLRLAQKLGFDTTDVDAALSYLSTVDPMLVVAAGFEDNIANSDGNNQPLTKPCVEKQFEGVESFILEHPLNIKATQIVPVIIGNNNNEFGFQYEKVDAKYFDSYTYNTQFDLGFKSDENLDEALEAISHFYIGDEKISDDVRFAIIDFGSDFIFGHPTQRMAEKLIDSGIEDVYRFIFSYDGGKNILKVALNMTAPGATHSDDLGYIFDYFTNDETAQDRLVVDRMIKLWTDFAKYGNPTPETSDLIAVKWTPMTKDTQYYLNINSDLTLESRPFHDRMAFWDVFYKLYGKYQKWYEAPGK